MIKYGITRIVFLIGKYAIKIPNPKRHLHFLQGCYNNYSERYYCKTVKGTEDYNLIAPSYFCSWFGIIQIQAKCEPIQNIEYGVFINLTDDHKPENFGLYNGRVVCLDYP